MAKGHQETGHAGGTTPAPASGNGAAAAHESLAALCARFSAADETAPTIREAFAYADESFVFGNGQFANVPWHLNNGRLDRLTRLAVAVIRAANKANAVDDESLGPITSAAEKLASDAITDGHPVPTLLEESVDNWFYQYAKMPADEKKAAGYDVALTVTGADGKLRLVTNFNERSVFVNRVLDKDLSATVPQGFPDAGRTWFDVTREAIVGFISTVRTYTAEEAVKAGDNSLVGMPKRKKPAKGKDGAVIATTNGAARKSAESVL